LKPLVVKPKIIAFGRGMPCQTALLALTLTLIYGLAWQTHRTIIVETPDNIFLIDVSSPLSPSGETILDECLSSEGSHAGVR
jgi:hypothetical protein